MRKFAIVSAVIVAIVSFGFPFRSRAATADHLVIAEVQVGGANPRDEFVEIYNPTSMAISLEGWRLSKRTGTGVREENLVTVFPAIDVPPQRSLLVAPIDSVLGAQADVVYTTQNSLSSNNTVVLYGYSPLQGDTRLVVDLVGFGEVMYREASAAPNPQNNQSIERRPGGIAGNGQDTDDNAADFLPPATPTPQNRNAAARPAVTIAPTDGTSASSGGTSDNTGSASGSTTSGDSSGGTSGGSGGNTTNTNTSGNASGGTSGSASNATSTSTNTSGDSGNTSSANTAESSSGSTSGGTSNATGTSQSTTSSSTSSTTANNATSSSNTETTSSNTAADTQSSSAGQGASSSGDGSSSPPPIPTHIRINEFVSDPASGDEWIELVNIGSTPVNLVDWIIEDGKETKTVLTGAVGIGDQRFFVLTKPKGQLNNSGDRIVLKISNGQVVDAVTYGDWDDGKTSDNAPVAADPASVARVTDGVDTNSDRLDFVRTETPTPGAPNVVSMAPTEDEQSAQGSNDRTTSSSVARPILVLNELLPNPVGDDSAEFIEIANIGGVNADLAGWRLRDELGTEYVIVSADGATSLAAGATLVFARARTGIALNNTGGEVVRLFASESERVASVAEYHGMAEEGWSWARGADGRWSWSLTPTPNTANVVAKPNRAPDAVVEALRETTVGAVVTFDGSDSADPDREAITHLWNFGDANTEADIATASVGRYVYDRSGTYTVTLTATDARGLATTAKHRISVRAPVAPANISEQLSNDARDFLRLSELLPNPTGSDDMEWIEVENIGDREANLRGWSVFVHGENSATERRAELASITVPAHGFALIRRSSTGVALRNTGAVVELRDTDGAVVDSVAYENVPEGESFARTDGGWIWTSAPTPGAANVTVHGNTRDVPVVQRSGTVAGAVAVRAGAASAVNTIAALRAIPIGQRVIVRGTVTAPLGSVGKQIFYIADAGGGVQVYSGAREIPKLTTGDRVEVRGELRDISGELRVGIATNDDVRMIGRGDAITPDSLRAQDASSDQLGSLVTVEGDIVEVRGRTITVDDGSDEVRIALPTATDENSEGAAVGDVIRTTGVLSRTRSGYRILARSAVDVVQLKRTLPAIVSTRTASSTPMRESAEVAVLGGSGALAATSLWRRRRLFILAFGGIRRILPFMRGRA